MAAKVDRREFLRSLGVGVGAAVGAGASSFPIIGAAQAQDKPRGTIPSTPFKIGHMTFFTGPAAIPCQVRTVPRQTEPARDAAPRPAGVATP